MPISFVCLAILLMPVVLLYASGRQRRRLEQVDWKDLVKELRPVPHQGIFAIADAYLKPRKQQIEIEPPDMLAMLGGIDGLAAIEHNSKVILQLAGYAAAWNEVEATIVTEIIRRDVERLQKAMTRLQWDILLRRMGKKAPFLMQEVAATYHLMTARLLALYETSHMGLHPVLAAAL